MCVIDVPLILSQRPTVESFGGPLGEERELEGTGETTIAETVCRPDPPKKSYDLSEQGMLVSQANVDEDKEPTNPVPPMDSHVDSPKFAGVTQYSNVTKYNIVQFMMRYCPILHLQGAGSSQMADVTKRLEKLESDRDEQKEEIQDLKTSREEHKQQMEKSKLKIIELETEAKKSELKVGKLLDKV